MEQLNELLLDRVHSQDQVFFQNYSYIYLFIVAVIFRGKRPVFCDRISPAWWSGGARSNVSMFKAYLQTLGGEQY